MKINVDFLDVKKVTDGLKNYEHIDFSLFVERIPKSKDELSKINIISLIEPNEYFGRHDWVIKNQKLFSAILTWDDKILNNCPNALFLPFGHTWFTKEQYEKTYEKEFKISHLCGVLQKTYGHSIRHEILARENELKIPTNFFYTYGDRNNIETAREDKVVIFGDTQFGVAIENTSHNGFFTEKILDCFLLKTVPIYWGCSNIEKYFNNRGIIKFENTDNFIEIVNKLDDTVYGNLEDVIEDNYERALKYVDYEQNICNMVIKIFEHNDIC